MAEAVWPTTDEQAELERRTLTAIKGHLKKRGQRPHVYECPLPHGQDGKDFYFDAETGQIGGCQGKHKGQLTRWKDLAEHARCPCPPRNGDQWRVNFSRVQWGHRIVVGRYVRVPGKKERTDDFHEDNWVWSPQGVINMHRPETWGYVQFSDRSAGSDVPFAGDPTARMRHLLHRVLYAQEQHRLERGACAARLEDLGLEALSESVVLEKVGGGWRARGTVRRPDGGAAVLVMDGDGRITRTRKAEK